MIDVTKPARSSRCAGLRPLALTTALAALVLGAASADAATSKATAASKTAKAHRAASAAAAASWGRRAAVGPAPVGLQRPTREILLSIGEGELVTLPTAVDRVWTSNPEAADVYVSSSRQIHLFGKAMGEATVFASTASGQVVFAASIRVSQNISSIDRVLQAALPDAVIHVTFAGQFAVLTGTVATPEDSAYANSVAISALNPGVKPGGDDALKIVVLNRLRTATPLQVNLQVRIAEVSRSLVKTLNSNLTTIDGTGGFKFGLGQGTAPTTFNTANGSPLAVGAAVQGYQTDPITGLLTLVNGNNLPRAGAGLTTLAGMGKLFGMNILGTLDAGETIGLVTTLAQPNLTALSGETADFLAGGEFPIPISQGFGTVSVEYKKYGVSLSYTPTVLADGRISLRVRPEVSELSSQGAITLGGYSIPALTTRRTETTIELGSGQSFMIAGLLSNKSQNAIQKLPGVGDMPILGPLFKSTTFQRGETELVIVVTPYLVQPVSDGDIKLPTDGIQAPDDIKRIFGNELTDGKSGAIRPHATGGDNAATPVDTPKVGAMTPASGATSGQAMALATPDTGAKASSQKTSKNATASAPGFTLN